MVRVRVEVPCHPTEDPSRVEAAVRNLFPEIAMERSSGSLVGVTARIDRLRDLIRNQKIRDTARGQLLGGRIGDRTTIWLSKQAAFAGAVNFAVGSPLGDIRVEIQDSDLLTLIDRLAESTVAPRIRSSDRTEGT